MMTASLLFVQHQLIAHMPVPFRREIVTIAEDDDIQQQRKAVQLIGGSASLPEWVEQPDGSFLRKGVGGGAGDPGGEGEDPMESEWNADDLLGAMPRQPAKLYEVPSPTVASPPPDGGFTYDSGVFPTILPPSLLASQLPLPAFEGEPMRPLRVTPQLRAAWSEVRCIHTTERDLFFSNLDPVPVGACEPGGATRAAHDREDSGRRVEWSCDECSCHDGLFNSMSGSKAD